MPLGEEIKDDFIILKENPVATVDSLDIPASAVKECPFDLIVLADDSGSEFSNDKSSVLFRYNAAVASIEMRLQQKQGSVWVDVDVLDNNDVGEFFSLGFIIDEKNRNYIGYLIHWARVLAIHGAGTYRVKTFETTILGTGNKTTQEWCLKEYTPERAEGTVKLEIITNSVRGDIDDETDFIDFGDVNWYNSYRLCGMFGFDTSDYVEEHTIFQNGSKQYVRDEQTPKYKLKLKRLPGWLHNIIKTDILQADEIDITDYNKNNPNTHIQRPVRRNGNYEPQWDERKRSKLAPVEIQFENRFDNLRKLRCTSQGASIGTGSSGGSSSSGGTVSANLKKSSFGIVLDGGGAVITTGAYGAKTMEYNGKVTGWDIFEVSDSPIASSIVIDVWKDVYGNYPPTVADTIFGVKPSLSSAIKNQNTGLNIAFNSGDVFRWNVDSVSLAKKIILIIKTIKT